MPIYDDKQIQPEKKSFAGTFDIFHLLNKISISIHSLLRGFNKVLNKHKSTRKFEITQVTWLKDQWSIKIDANIW